MVVFDIASQLSKILYQMIPASRKLGENVVRELIASADNIRIGKGRNLDMSTSHGLPWNIWIASARVAILQSFEPESRCCGVWATGLGKPSVCDTIRVWESISMSRIWRR